MSELFAQYRAKLDGLVGPRAVERIRDRARKDAVSATARDQIDEMTAGETEAMNNCVGLLRELHGKGTEILNEDHLRRMKARDDVVAELKSLPLEAKSQVTRLLDASRPRVQASYAKKNQLIRVLRAFQDEHDIHDVPEERNRFWCFAILVAMLVAETVLNGSMLAKTNLYGLVGAWGEAFFISFCNISLGFVNGTCSFRYLKLKSEHQKIHLKAAAYASPAGIILFNFLFGHYRYITDPTIIDNINAILDSIAGQPFSIFLSMKTLSLFIAGLVFSGIASYEGYVIFTPHLGYYDKFQNWDNARKDCESLREDAFSNATDIYTKNKDKVFTLQDKITENIIAVDSSMKRSLNTVASYKSFTDDTVEGYRELFRAYRKTYEQVRGEQIPELPANIPPLPHELCSLIYDERGAKEIYDYVDTKRIEFDTEKTAILAQLLDGENRAYQEITQFFESYENEQGLFAEEQHCAAGAEAPVREEAAGEPPVEQV